MEVINEPLVFGNLFFLYLFLPLCVIIYSIAQTTKTKNIILAIFSLMFYVWGRSFIWLGLILFTATFDYLNGLIITKNHGKPIAKVMVTVSVVTNLALLGFFKYTDFFIENINNLTGSDIAPLKLPFPLGISFYSFMTISYVVDCYWEKTKAERNFLTYLTYISFFGHITAGPITRYTDMRESLHERKYSLAGVSTGFTRIAVGLAKKVLIADNLYKIVETFFGGEGSISGLSFLTTIVIAGVYALFVYYDFSGYCDIAIGIGKLLGLKLSENFDYPFISKDISEFWRRWHITLGSWFRDYLLYIPIFGLRNKYLSLFVVWFCTGFWHGASWNFIIWGLYFGAFILIEGLIGKKRMKKIPIVIKHIYTKLVLIIGFGIFYFTDLTKLGDFFKNLVFANNNAFADDRLGVILGENLFIILAALLFCFPVARAFEKAATTKKAYFMPIKTVQVVGTIALFVICSILLVDNTSQPFLYAQF